jgi:small multidrug resistance pump
MGWGYLAAAIFFEICGTTALKLSDGLSRIVPTAVVVVCYLLSFAFLSNALRQIDLGIAYAIWCGVGMAAVAAIGIIWFREPVTGLKIASLVLIAAGAAGLNLSSGR